MTLNQFVKANTGKKIDFDGRYGAQCVDLYRAYCRDVLNVPQSPGVEGAKDLIRAPGSLGVIRDSAFTDYSSGDILVWDATKTNPYGHVAVLISVCNARDFVVFEQDGFRQDGAKLALRSREGLLGAMRKKSEN